jgi:hypothetical protein
MTSSWNLPCLSSRQIPSGQPSGLSSHLSDHQVPVESLLSRQHEHPCAARTEEFVAQPSIPFYQESAFFTDGIVQMPNGLTVPVGFRRYKVRSPDLPTLRGGAGRVGGRSDVGWNGYPS